MRISVSAFTKETGTHLFNYRSPKTAHDDVTSALKALTARFGRPRFNTHETKHRQRICWTFPNGARIVKTLHSLPV